MGSGYPGTLIYVNGCVEYSQAIGTIMIRNFKDRTTQRFFEGERVLAYEGFADRAARRLTLLDCAEALRDLAGLPSNRLEALHGGRAGQHSIRIITQWRICFRWTDEGPCSVEIVDYH